MDERDDLLLLAVLIDRIATEHRAAAMQAAAAEGLPENLAEALWSLGGLDTSPSMSEVAEGLRCDPSNATVLVGQLEIRGLVVRAADTHDRRRRIVAVTDAGARVLESMAAEVATTSPLRQLTADDRSALLAALPERPDA